MTDFLLIIPSLREGGAEKFSVNLFNSFEGNEITELLCVTSVGSFYDLIKFKDNVTILNKKRILSSVLSIYFFIIKKRPKIILTMFLHLSAVVLCLKALGLIKSKIFIREVNLPISLLSSKKFSLLYRLIYKYLYPFSDVVICQSQDMFNELKTLTSANLCIINNPVDFESINNMVFLNENSSLENFDHQKNHLTFIGRLTYQKGIDILFEFITKLSKDEIVHVIGSGQLHGWLKKQIETVDLNCKVILHGKLSNPFWLLSHSKFLIMTSRYEGFPNVALESLALGVPILALPFKGGREEIFENEVNCLLASDMTSEALFEAYKRSMFIKFDKSIIINNTLSKFDISIISKKYKELFFK